MKQWQKRFPQCVLFQGATMGNPTCLRFTPCSLAWSLTRKDTGGCFLARPSTSSSTRLKTDTIRRSYSLSVWSAPWLPYSWKLHRGVSSEVMRLRVVSLRTRQRRRKFVTFYESVRRRSPCRLRVQYERFDHMGDEQAALLLAKRRVKEMNERRRNRRSNQNDKIKKERLKDTAPRCGGWRNRRRRTTGADRSSELPDCGTRPCTPSSGEFKKKKNNF